MGVASAVFVAGPLSHDKTNAIDTIKSRGTENHCLIPMLFFRKIIKNGAASVHATYGSSWWSLKFGKIKFGRERNALNLKRRPIDKNFISARREGVSPFY
jgi:hypothetical protein